MTKLNSHGRSIGLLALLVFSCSGTAPAEDKIANTADGETLFEVPVGNSGQTLFVARGAYIEPSIVAGVRKTSLPDLKPRYYEVRAELRSPNKPAVLIGARLRGESGTISDTGSVVLSSLIEPGKIILLVAEGPGLYFRSIGIPGGNTWVPFASDKRWRKAAAAYRIDGNLMDAKLSRSKEGKLTVELLEKLSGTTNVFEDMGDDMKRFRLVRQWSGRE